MNSLPLRWRNSFGAYLYLPLPIRWPRPIIGAKRRRRQSAFIRKIRVLRIVIERVAHSKWLWYGGCPSFHTILANNSCFGPVPLLVRAGNSKLIEPVAVANSQTLAHA